MRFWALTAICAVIPDIDIFWRRLLTDRSSMWGHRGIAHSLLAAVIFGLLAACICWRPKRRASSDVTEEGIGDASSSIASASPYSLFASRSSLLGESRSGRAFMALWLTLTLATASHAMLDMLSNGYHGVMLLAPFDTRALAFAWQPIWTVPAWFDQAFPSLASHDARGLWLIRLTLSEIIVVWIPMTILLLTCRAVRRVRRKSLDAGQ